MQTKIKCLVLCMMIGLLSIFPISVQSNAEKWQKISNGIYGGIIRSVVQSNQTPELMYCATFGKGIFKSENRGESWTSVNNGLGNLYTLCLAIHPKNEKIMLVGTWGFGVYRTNDGGQNWVRSMDETSYYIISFLHFDPDNEKVAYAFTDKGMYISGNQGISFSYSPADFMKNAVDFFYTPPQRSNKFYVGARNLGLFYSVNKGQNWKTFPRMSQLTPICSVAEDPENENIVYVGTSRSGLYKFRYNDFEETWIPEKVGLENHHVTSILFNPLNTNEMIVSTFNAGIFYSLDKGKTFSNNTEGPGSTEIRFMVWDKTLKYGLWAATHGQGLWHSYTKTIEWQERNNNLEGLIINGHAIDPNHPSTLYCFTYGNVFKSTDSGENWTRSSRGLINFDVKNLSINPRDSNIIYASLDGGGIYKSDDAGLNWYSINDNLKYKRIFTISINPTNSRHLLAGSFGKGIYQSFDEGSNWTLTNKGIEDGYVTTIQFHPKNHGEIYVGTYSGGVFKSFDNGQSWREFNAGLDGKVVLVLLIDNVDPDVVYCGMEGYRSFKSTNGGLSWKPLDQGLDQKVSRSFAFHKSSTDLVYCAGINGVFYSANRGVYWTSINQGLDENTGLGVIDANCISIDKTNPRVLFLSTYNGMYRYEHHEIPDIDRIAPSILLDHEDTTIKTNKAIITLTGKVVDTYSGVMRFEINHEEILLSPEGKFEKNIALQAGDNLIELMAVDYAGNIAELHLKVWYDDGVDRYPPILTIDHPIDGLKTYQALLIIRGRVEDHESGVQLVEINNKRVNFNEQGVFEYEFMLDAGENKIRFKAMDIVGNESNEVRSVFFLQTDKTPPIIEILSPLNKSVLREKSLKIIGRVFDNESEVTHFAINDDAVLLDPMGNFSHSLTLQKGANQFSLVAINKAGLKSETILTVEFLPKEVVIVLFINNSMGFIDDKRVFLDAPPFIHQNRTVVPLRFIGEAFGATIDWNAAHRTITLDILSKDLQIVLIVDNKTAYVNGKKQELDIPPLIKNSRTFVPLRFIGETLGCSIEWEASEQKITLVYSE